VPHPVILERCQTGVQLRQATASDAGAIASLLLHSFAEYEKLYTAMGFAATILDRDQVLRRINEGPVWVAFVNDEIVGSVSALWKADGSVYIRGMAVLPSARGKHIGETMLNAVHAFAVEGKCWRLFLSTTPFLSAAVCLYQRFGFERTAEGPHDLFGTPLFTMSKKLNLTPEISSHQ
jgi:N-acetylglutamate synthase-like GNAT family acetyltransferase